MAINMVNTQSRSSLKRQSCTCTLCPSVIHVTNYMMQFPQSGESLTLTDQSLHCTFPFLVDIPTETLVCRIRNIVCWAPRFNTLHYAECLQLSWGRLDIQKCILRVVGGGGGGVWGVQEIFHPLEIELFDLPRIPLKCTTYINMCRRLLKYKSYWNTSWVCWNFYIANYT